MSSVGIICEYNPFHNGHLFHLNEVKRLFPGHTIILVMSGNFTERGDVSILNKWDKTTLALEFGIDLVIELPFVFATQSADTFAQASIAILAQLQVDYLVFGSECNDIKRLTEMANIQLDHKKYDHLVKEFLETGMNYPTALSKALYTLTGKRINKPNDILGVTYIREILKQNSKIKAVTIKRNNDYNSIELNDSITSASSIRYALEQKEDISHYVPKETLSYIQDPHFLNDYFPFLKYKLLTDTQLEKYLTVDEGIENRIRKFIISARSINELILKIKTKRYTYNKLNRMFLHILVGFIKEEKVDMQKVSYIRVLGFSQKGRSYLKQVKNQVTIPLITNYSDIKDPILEMELRATALYASIFPEKEKIDIIESEYKNYPIIR